MNGEWRLENGALLWLYCEMQWVACVMCGGVCLVDAFLCFRLGKRLHVGGAVHVGGEHDVSCFVVG